mgnify:CR=1 FL=1
MKYRKRPIIVDAVQWTGQNHREMFEFLGGKSTEFIQAEGKNFYIDFSKVEGGLIIRTLEGEHKASIGDYVVKGIKDEFWPVKPDIFELSYEKEPAGGFTE